MFPVPKHGTGTKYPDIVPMNVSVPAKDGHNGE